jgi:hypothetical protein
MAATLEPATEVRIMTLFANPTLPGMQDLTWGSSRTSSNTSSSALATMSLRNRFESHPAGLERVPPRVMRRSIRWLIPA